MKRMGRHPSHGRLGTDMRQLYGCWSREMVLISIHGGKKFRYCTTVWRSAGIELKAAGGATSGSEFQAKRGWQQCQATT